MLSDAALTTEDPSSFWGYWDSVKGVLTTLRGLPARITSLMTKSTTLKFRANKVGAKALADKAAESGSTLASMLNTAMEVKTKIDTYMPDWMASSSQPRTSGLSAYWIPITIGIGGLAAIAYVASNGLQLIKDYQIQERIIQGVEKDVLSVEQAQKLIKGTIPPTRITLPQDTIFGSATTALFTPIGWLIAGLIGIQILAPKMLNFKNWGK